MDASDVGPTFDRLCESNCPRHGTGRRLFASSLVLTAWCLLWRVRPQWPTNWIWMETATGNWKRVPKFPKHSTFAGDACRFCRPPGKPHETKPSVNLKDQTDVDDFSFFFFFFSFPPFLRWGKMLEQNCCGLENGQTGTGLRYRVGRVGIFPFEWCVWNFVFLFLLSLHRLRIFFFADLS